METIFCESEKTGIPKTLILYEYPIRVKENFKGNKKLKAIDVFVDPKELPPKIGNSIEFILSSSTGSSGGNVSLIVKEVAEFENSTAMVGYSPEAGLEFYLVIKNRPVN